MTDTIISKHKYKIGQTLYFENSEYLTIGLPYVITNKRYKEDGSLLGYNLKGVAGYWTENYIDTHKIKKAFLLNADGVIEVWKP